MLQSDPMLRLPTSDELPSSDDKPVDNELQTLVPNLLRFILVSIWPNRFDWFFGVNMGIYHTTGSNPRIPIVPDGFLSLGIERLKGETLRKSYVVWEENYIVPTMVLEVVSETYGGEYDEKIDKYSGLGVLYYVIYNSDFYKRDKHQPFEVYKLVDGEYVLQAGEPFWMPEIGLGIGREMGTHDRLFREWLYWYDQQGNRFPTPEETAISERQQRELAQQQKAELELLLARYRQRFGDLPEGD